MSETKAVKARRLKARAFVHDVMAQLHAIMGCSGLTYAQVARKVGEPRETIERMFHDFDFVSGDPSAVRLAAQIASATGHQLRFSLPEADAGHAGTRPLRSATARSHLPF